MIDAGEDEAASGTCCLGQTNCPRWLRTARSFSLYGLLPNAEFSALQQTTQLSSSLEPPFADATRCSTLASPAGMNSSQKKQRRPCITSSRSSCFMVTYNVKVTGTLRQGAARCRISNGVPRRVAATCPSRPTCHTAPHPQKHPYASSSTTFRKSESWPTSAAGSYKCHLRSARFQ